MLGDMPKPPCQQAASNLTYLAKADPLKTAHGEETLRNLCSLWPYGARTGSINQSRINRRI